MNNSLELYLKDLTLEKLIRLSAGDKIQRIIHVLEIIQEYILGFQEKQEPEDQTKIKKATIMTFVILKKISEGKNLKEFTSHDWEEIVKNISEQDVLKDDKLYTVFIFSVYEGYIRASTKYMESYAKPKTVEAIKNLADELNDKTDLLQNNQITEASYIEDCLWILLEAMIKLISSNVDRLGDNEIMEFTKALAECAFEYGRLNLLKREQEIVKEFIESQYVLDQELEQKYAAFKKELEQRVEQFYALIDNAFVPDFRESFLHSITLAQAVGAKKEEVLFTEDDIDSFFTD